MKLETLNKSSGDKGLVKRFGETCVVKCQKVLAQIKAARGAILVESKITLNIEDRLLRLALNEAEALAWQTVFPNLVFPALAAEKVQAVAAWNTHQQLVRNRTSGLAQAA